MQIDEEIHRVIRWFRKKRKIYSCESEMNKTSKYPLILIVSSVMVTMTPFTMVSAQKPGTNQDTVKSSGTLIQPVYTTTRLVTGKPVIDGRLDDECWKNGTWAGDYTQFIPDEGAKPTWPTELNIQYDDKNLYIAFRAFDGEPEKMTKRAGVRDEIVGDMMGITFDSYRDYRTGFEFTLTSWGQKVDLVLFNPMNWDFNWNAVWKGRTGIEDSAWVAEIEVPFSQLRYSGEEEQVWGMHTWRWIDRLQEESNWEKQSKKGPGMLYNFGELRGIKGLPKSRRLEIMPFALGKLETMEEIPGNPYTTNGRRWGGNAGLDAKIGISSNFTVDLTVNPDFGQVESDPSVMNLSAFETFYEEKRPFFLEGLTIFDYKFDNQSLFYSRRIGHQPSLPANPAEREFQDTPDQTTILSALKLSGTTSKGLSVGLLQSLTANEYATISEAGGTERKTKVEPLTSYTVARVQKGYNAGTTVIGGIVTSVNRQINDPSLESLSSNALTGGLDMLHRFHNKEFFVDTRLTGSYINGSSESITGLQESSARYYQRPDAGYVDFDTTRTSLSGYGGKFKIGKGAGGFWRYSAGVTWLSPGLELNDLGYMNTADEINQVNEITYFVNQPVSVFRTYNITLEQFNSWNFGGTYLGSGGHLSFSSEFKNQWTLAANMILHSGAYDPKLLRGGNDMLMPWRMTAFGTIGTNQAKKATLSLEGRYEYTGENSAANWQIEPAFSVRPFTMLRLRISALWEDNRNDLQYVAERAYYSDPRYVLGTIDQTTLGLTFRIDLNLTPEFSIQYYGSPFISRGRYSRLKYLTDPNADQNDKRFRNYDNVTFSDGYYYFDEDNDMVFDYTVPDPDFNFHQFRSNLVAKWEYRLGSFIYFVWSVERTGNTTSSDKTIRESFKELTSIYPNNIFLIKLSYWFTL